jgi:hypothetical protein
MIIIDNHRYMDADLHYKQKCRGGDGSNPKRGEGGRVTHATFAWCGARAREPPRWLERQKSQSFTMDHITAALRATCGWLAAVPGPCWLLCALLPLLPGLLALAAGCCSWCPWLAGLLPAAWWPSLCLRALLLPPAPVERARAPKATCRAPTLESKFPRHHCVTGATGGSCACTAYRLVRACRRRGRIHDSSSSAGGLQVVGCAIEWHRVLGYVTGRLRQRRCRRVGAARSRNVFVVNGGGAVNVWLASA